MTIMYADRNPRAYDASRRDFDRTYAALDKLARSKAVPAKTQVEARVIRDEVWRTGVVGNSRVWVINAWANYMVGGSIGFALVVALIPLAALYGSHPLLSVVAYGVTAYGAYRVTGVVRRRVFLSRGKLPKT